MQTTEVWAIGAIVLIIVLVNMLMKKRKIVDIIFAEAIIICAVLMVEKSLCPFYLSPEKNYNSNLNALFNSLIPFAQLQEFYVSSSKDIAIEYPESAAFFGECLTKLIGYIVLDFSCSCIISALIFYFRKNIFVSWLSGFAICVSIVISKMVAYCNIMLDSYHFFDTTEIAVCALGALAGVLCSKIIIDYHNGKIHE